jgi:hypothetical protein
MATVESTLNIKSWSLNLKRDVFNGRVGIRAGDQEGMVRKKFVDPINIDSVSGFLFIKYGSTFLLTITNGINSTQVKVTGLFAAYIECDTVLIEPDPLLLKDDEIYAYWTY